jgi:hypothetical protein
MPSPPHITLALDALTTPFLIGLAAVGLPVLLSKEFDTLWVIGARRVRK